MDYPETPQKQSFKAQLKTLEAKKVTAILGVSLGLYLGGWLFFYVILDWDRSPSSPRYVEPGPAVSLQDNSAKTGEKYAIDKIEMPERPQDPLPASVEHVLEGNARTPAIDPPPKVPEKQLRYLPPGETPPGVGLVNKGISRKCWTHDGLQYSEKDCNAVDGLFETIAERLYLFDQCRKDVVGKNSLGRLDLGIEFDLQNDSLSLWNNPSSTIRSSFEIVTCIKSSIEGLSLAGFEPLFSRYQVVFSVQFEGARKKVAPTPKPAGTSSAQVSSTAASRAAQFPLGRFGDGRFVMVNRDRVRIREKPVDGHMLGKISSGSRVFLLEQHQDWCRVRTRRGNVGWMVCWALDLK
jgi:hypothetical protein